MYDQSIIEMHRRKICIDCLCASNHTVASPVIVKRAIWSTIRYYSWHIRTYWKKKTFRFISIDWKVHFH